MNWNEIEGKWEQVKGAIREKWGKLTDDDLTQIKGRRDQLEGKLREKYGYAQDRVAKEVNQFLSSDECTSCCSKSSTSSEQADRL